VLYIAIAVPSWLALVKMAIAVDRSETGNQQVSMCDTHGIKQPETQKNNRGKQSGFKVSLFFIKISFSPSAVRK
jgi:hypothetical protein